MSDQFEYEVYTNNNDNLVGGNCDSINNTSTTQHHLTVQKLA